MLNAYPLDTVELNGPGVGSGADPDPGPDPDPDPDPDPGGDPVPVEPALSFTWRMLLVIGGVDFSAQLTGAVSVDREEGAAGLATVTIFLPPGPVVPTDWIGRPVTLDYVSEQAGVVTQSRRFTGQVSRTTPWSFDMALGDARRASGKAMEGARRAIGTTNEAERRAIGKAMEASRRGTTVDDINAVVTPPRPAKTLPEVQSRGALPAATGSADFKPRATTSTGGGGIASPLVEKTKVVEGKTLPDREYWEGGLPSTDGLLIYPAVKTFNLTDATGADVQLQLANPAGA